jgi:pyruvate dehydrogenase E2 component (dihydrolipoamide acetyltransferase)
MPPNHERPTRPTGMLTVTVESSPQSTAPLPASAALKGDTTVREPDRLGRALARRVAEARATVPDLELEHRIDAGAILAITGELGCSVTAVLARACATVLRECPHANAAYRDGHFELYSRVNLGIAVLTGDGLLTPTVLDADAKSVEQLSEEITRLAQRSRAGELTPPEQAGATFTLADLGELGVDRWSAPSVANQAAALTAGAIRPAAVVRDGALVAGHELALTLVCDHRILFGARAAEVLTRIAQLLESPRQ